MLMRDEWDRTRASRSDSDDRLRCGVWTNVCWRSHTPPWYAPAVYSTAQLAIQTIQAQRTARTWAGGLPQRRCLDYAPLDRTLGITMRWVNRHAAPLMIDDSLTYPAFDDTRVLYRR